MDDSELQAIRAARLREMQSASSNSGGGAPTNAASMRLHAALEPAARERIERVRLVKPERAAQVENHLTQVYRGGKITEADVVSLLGQLDQKQRGPTITFQRRETVASEGEDDDGDDDFFN